MAQLDWRLIEDVFGKACDLPLSKRMPFIASLNLETRVREQVHELVASHDESVGFLDSPITGAAIELISDDDSSQLEDGTVLGGFDIVRTLGYGGIATVYLAKDRLLGRHVALKISSVSGVEGQTLAVLDHPNIVRVFSESDEVGRHIICMEYVRGPTMSELIADFVDGSFDGAKYWEWLESYSSAKQKLSGESSSFEIPSEFRKLDGFDLFFWFALQVMDGLQHAHQRGVLHLDLKPKNILLDITGKPKLADFNVSLVSKTESTEGVVGLIGGTKEYMCAEQAKSISLSSGDYLTKASESWDLYSVGRILEELYMNIQKPDEYTDRWFVHLDVNQLLERMLQPGSLRTKDVIEEWHRLYKKKQMLASIPKLSTDLQKKIHKHPFTSPFVVSLLPQFAGSFVNISYNYFMIVDNLDEQHNQMFVFLLELLNPIIYGISLLIAFYLWGRFAKIYRQSVESQGFASNYESLRRIVVGFPRVLRRIMFFAWFSGAFLFPVGLYFGAGPFDYVIGTHFVISFCLAWLVASTYTHLANSVLMLRGFYCTLWNPFVAVNSKAELQRAEIKENSYALSAIITPLSGACLLIAFEPIPEKAFFYKIFILFFIALGILGAVTSLYIRDYLAKFQRTFIDHM